MGKLYFKTKSAIRLANFEKTYPDRRRFESLHANDIWQSDCMYRPYINVDGKMRRAYLFAIIDDASRLITHAEFYMQQNLDCYKDCIMKALSKIRMQFLPLCSDALTLDALNAKLTDWFNNEYNNRVHSSTNKIPYVRYFEDIQLINESPKYMTDYFRKRVNHKVDKDRTVTLINRIFFGFSNEPFPHDLKVEQILNTPTI